VSRFSPLPACTRALLLVLSLLAATTAVAQSRTAPCGQGVRHIELKPDSISELPEVCISPRLVTVLSFDADLAPDSVTVEGRERFAKVDPGDSILKLVPSERLRPGERLLLTVRFKDGAAPVSASFWLVVHPSRAEPLVEVSRQRRTVESYQQEVRDKDSWLRQCQEENARLDAQSEGSAGLAALLDAGILDIQGIAAKNLTRIAALLTGSDLQMISAYSYRSSTRVAVEVWLKLAGEAQPWTVAGAELVGLGPSALLVLPPQQREPIRFGDSGQRILIEAEATEAEAQGTFTLKLWDASRSRSVTLTGVTFPQPGGLTKPE
jgi:uncharacterized protein (TIGR02268 family)